MTGNSPPAGLGFTCPETTRVDGIALAALIRAAAAGDAAALAAFRAASTETENFDLFVAGQQRLLDGDAPAAADLFRAITPGAWQVAAMVLRSLAALGARDLRQAYAIANATRDSIEAARLAREPGYLPVRDLVMAGLQAVIGAEDAYPPAGPVSLSAPFRYLISYPRSGSTALRVFLHFAFAAPRYSVYPGDGRYFSRRFHDPAPGHAVFVKDHEWCDDYAEDESLGLVRDGRNAILSYARFLFIQGATQQIRRGELADFIGWTAGNPPLGFWGDHTRRLIEARDRGARLEILRYEDYVGDFGKLCGLARRLAAGTAAICEDEAQYRALSAPHIGAAAERWGQSITLPADSFIPQDWAIGAEKIRWQDSFDAAGARRFHELGGTELLMRLGYETDEAWWRQF